MSRGYNKASSEVRDPRLKASLSVLDAEAYLVKNGNRGYPANGEDIRAQYAEEAYESRANGLRAPNYQQWLQQQVARRERASARENSRERLINTPEGKEIERAFTKAKAFHSEAAQETNKAREALEKAFLKEQGQQMGDYMDRASNRGRTMNDIDDSIKAIVPQEHAKLEKAHATEQALYAEYQKREKARKDFLES